MGEGEMITNGLDSANPRWLRECADLEHGYDQKQTEGIDGSAATSGWPYDVKPAPYNYQVAGNHYEDMAIQPHEYIVKNRIGWSAGNAIKYLSRYQRKGGADDVKKAIHYCQLLLAEEYGE
jgi:Protein of unknwon function (DUF3310)